MPIIDKESWKRGEAIADRQRDYLFKTNLSAIAAIYVLAIFLTQGKSAISILWILCPVILFSLGIAAIHLSLISAKHRATKRAKGFTNEFPWYKSSWPYDAASLIFLIIGFIVGVFKNPVVGAS